MKWKFWNKTTWVKAKDVRLVVTGMCKESDQIKLAEAIKEKGVNTVVTSLPVLGIFDL